MHVSRPPLSRREWLRWSGAGLATLGGCAAPPVFEPPPQAVEVAALPAGKTWRYRVVNRYNGEAVGTAAYSAGADGRIAVRLPSSNVAAAEPDVPRTGAVVFTDRHHVSEELFFDAPYRFEQPDRLLPENLNLGRAPLTNNRYRRPDESQPLRWTSQVTGEGWERIDVPAGRFLALRVHRTIWFDHPDIARRRNVRSDRLWFAPAFGFWVCREWSGQYLVPDVKLDVRLEDWVRFELA